MIQRMGRTGRKRQGRVVVLVTEGREQQTLADCLQQKNCLSANILNSKHLLQHCYTDNPRMIPEAVTPGCQKMFITVREKTSTKKVGNTIKVKIILLFFFYVKLLIFMYRACLIECIHHRAYHHKNQAAWT